MVPIKRYKVIVEAVEVPSASSFGDPDLSEIAEWCGGTLLRLEATAWRPQDVYGIGIYYDDNSYHWAGPGDFIVHDLVVQDRFYAVPREVFHELFSDEGI